MEKVDRSYRYENIAATLPRVSQIGDPQEGDRGTMPTGVIVVFRNGEWRYL
jgi:hypothetical protein